MNKHTNHRNNKLYIKYKSTAQRLQKAFSRNNHLDKTQQLRRLYRYERQLKRLGIAVNMSLYVLGFSPELTAQFKPVGDEFRVNVDTTNGSIPSIDFNSKGDFVIAWESFLELPGDPPSAPSFNIFAQRYSSDGTPQGSEFLVNTHTTYGQSDPSVGLDEDGNFVIAWESNLQDGDNVGIYAQLYASDGTPQGSEFLVNTYTTARQHNPSVVVDSDGDFVIVWEGFKTDGSKYSIYMQRYASDGTPQGGESLVNTFNGSQRSPDIAMDSEGNFIVVWESSAQDGDDTGIYAQRFASDGTPQGNEFLVNTITAYHQEHPNVGVDSDGDFVIAWNNRGIYGYGTHGIYAQRYASNGVRQGSEFQVNTDTTNHQFYPAVELSSEGDFVIAWQSGHYSLPDQDGDGYGIFARYYKSNGTPQGGKFQVNTYTTDSQSRPTIGADKEGDFIIAWQGAGLGSNGQNVPYEGIYAKRYNVLADIKNETESQVNICITDDQIHPDVGTDKAGNFVIVWESQEQDGDGYGIYAQRYSRNGEPQGDEFQVNTYTTEDQVSPAVGMDDDGDFVITWESFNQYANGSGHDIYAQRYDKDGMPQGGEFLVNSYTSSAQRNPSVAMDSDGDFVISWQSYGQDGDDFGIFARRYNKNGIPQGNEFQVNTHTTYLQDFSNVGMDSNGDFVIVWQSGGLDNNGQDGDSYGIFAQRYASDGTPQDNEFQVNSYTTSNQLSPSISVNSDGNFIIAWQSFLQDDSFHGIYAQRYANDGTPQGGEFQVNTYTTNRQTFPSVGMDNAGDFVITWQSYGQDGSQYGIYAQQYNSDGTSLGSEFQVNSYTTSFQGTSSVEMDDDGDFVVAWQSYEQDGDGYDIYARRYIDSTCKGVLVLPNETIQRDTVYDKWINIESRQVLQNGIATIEVVYEADSEIILKDGFHAQFGIEFEAILKACIEVSSLATSTNAEEDTKHTTSNSIISSSSQSAIFPNPVRDFLTFQIPDHIEQQVRLNIIDINGEIVWTENSNISTINVSQLPPGTYFLQIQTEDDVQQLKFIKL